MAFLEEAKVRWAGRQDDSLTDLSAAVLLNIACNHHGDDKNGLLYLDAAADMGRRLHLFDESDESAFSSSDDDVKRAASFAAWGVFGWHT